jgi:hypothetical protein
VLVDASAPRGSRAPVPEAGDPGSSPAAPSRVLGPETAPGVPGCHAIPADPAGSPGGGAPGEFAGGAPAAEDWPAREAAALDRASARDLLAAPEPAGMSAPPAP